MLRPTMRKDRQFGALLLPFVLTSFAACGADKGVEPPAVSADSVAKFLSGWAAAEGTEKDAATGYPKRIKRRRDGGEMVLIPAGTFQMGAVPSDTYAWEDESPRHAVTLTKAYYMDVNEVTVRQWMGFVGGGGGRLPTDLRRETTDLHPIHFVDHAEATAFASWAGAALPTEAQWERAAKGGHDDFVYPWGTADDEQRRNGVGGGDGFDGLASTGSFRPNAYGLYDMAGNVFEWCACWYGEKYYGGAPDRDPSGPRAGSLRVVRSGSWHGSADDGNRVSIRNFYDPTNRRDDLGFRLARSL